MDNATPTSHSKSKMIWYVVGALLVLMVGCAAIGSIGSKIAEKTMEGVMERASGGKAKVDMKDDGTMEVKTADGTMNVGTATVPDEWPKDAPVYPGATASYSATMNGSEGKQGLALVLMTTDSQEVVATYYKAELVKEGWTMDGTMQGGGTTILTATKDTRTFSAAITETDGRTAITIGVEMGVK